MPDLPELGEPHVFTADIGVAQQVTGVARVRRPDGTITVDAEGELTFSVPMRLRHEPVPDYDDWGDDE